MIKLIPISVRCHSGYKADECPKSFLHDDTRYEIIAITDRWYQGEIDPDIPVSDYFKVETADRKNYILKHDLEKDIWYLCI